MTERKPKPPKGITISSVVIQELTGYPDRGVWLASGPGDEGFRVVVGPLTQQEWDADLAERDRCQRIWEEAHATRVTSLDAWIAFTDTHDAAYIDAHREEYETLYEANRAASDASYRALTDWLVACRRLDKYREMFDAYLLGYYGNLIRLAKLLEKREGGAESEPRPDPNAPILVRAAGYLAEVKRIPERSGYEATVSVLPGVRGSGGTQATAVRRLTDAIPGYLAALKAMGKKVPDPQPLRPEVETKPAVLEDAERALAKPPRYRPKRRPGGGG